LGDERRVGVEWEGFCPVGEEEEQAGSHPANPEEIETQVEPFFQESMAIGVEEVLEEEDEAEQAGNQQDGADEVGGFFG
jgi:hypothetical protein